MATSRRSYVSIRAAALRTWLRRAGLHWELDRTTAFHAGFDAAWERLEEIRAAWRRSTAVLNVEIVRLRGALQRYGQHDATCSVSEHSPCSCGLAEAQQ